jgi:hypothetical protein
MDYCTRLLLGIKDPNLIFDPKFAEHYISEGFYHHQKGHLVHLLQTYSCFCPVCHQKMLRNGFKLTKTVGLPSAGDTNILYIRKQKFIALNQKSVPKLSLKLLKLLVFSLKNIFQMQLNTGPSLR